MMPSKENSHTQGAPENSIPIPAGMPKPLHLEN
jgi:hypothetical protein